MKTIKNYFGLFILLLAVIACNEDEVVETPFEEPQNIEEAIANIFQPMVDGDSTVGLSVGIVKGNELKQFFFGEKEKGTNLRPDENTLYEIGSITKTMTTTVLAQLVLDGDLSLDDPVEDYLPQVSKFPAYQGEKITFRQLADHTSALPYIPDNFDQNGFDESNPFKNYNSPMLYGFLNDYNLSAKPGTVQEYSNLGMGLLGHAAGKVKSSSFEHLLQNLVISSIGMNDSHVLLSDDHSNVAVPYNKRLKPVPMWDMSECTLGAGGVKSSLKDMLKYLKANMGHTQIPVSAALELAHQTSQELNYPFVMGLGWVKIVSQVDGTELIWHNGGTGGSVAFIGFVKELDMGVVMLFNTEINERSGTENLELLKGVEVIEAMKRFY